MKTKLYKWPASQYIMDYPNIAVVDKPKVELIEIKIKQLNQLFNSMDPSPFLEKDLDDDAFEYIVSSVMEHHVKTKINIIIHLPLKEKKHVLEEDVRHSIHHFFDYKARLAERGVKLKIQEGQKSLLIGLIALFICLLLREWITATYSAVLARILGEGLVIGGWVAMWKPISNILYDWWPMQNEKKIYEKISKTEIEFKYV